MKHLGKQFMKFAAVLAIDHDMTEQETWYLIRDFADNIITTAESNCDCEACRANSETTQTKPAGKTKSNPSKGRSATSRKTAH